MMPSEVLHPGVKQIKSRGPGRIDTDRSGHSRPRISPSSGPLGFQPRHLPGQTWVGSPTYRKSIFLCRLFVPTLPAQVRSTLCFRPARVSSESSSSRRSFKQSYIICGSSQARKLRCIFQEKPPYTPSVQDSTADIALSASSGPSEPF